MGFWIHTIIFELWRNTITIRLFWSIPLLFASHKIRSRQPLSSITDALAPHVIFFLLLPSSITEQHPPPSMASDSSTRASGLRWGTRGPGGTRSTHPGSLRPEWHAELAAWVVRGPRSPRRACGLGGTRSSWLGSSQPGRCVEHAAHAKVHRLDWCAAAARSCAAAARALLLLAIDGGGCC